MIRALDLVLSAAAILMLSPLLLLICVVLRFTGEGEVLYLQERVGLQGKPFRVIKFATMLKESPNLAGGYLTRQDDPRVLPVGRVLRKAKLNELPQLVNVLLGQMSLVGPRPQALVHHELYTPQQKAAIERQRPGITGLGSLVFRDEERLLARSGDGADDAHDRLIAPFKGELERWWAEHRSPSLYLKVLALTALAVVNPSFDCLRFFPSAPRPGGELRAILSGE